MCKHANVMLLICIMGEGCHMICFRQVKSKYLGSRLSVYISLIWLTGCQMVVTDLEVCSSVNINDSSSDLVMFIFYYIFDSSKKDPDVLPKVVVNLSMLLQDSSVQVQKRVIQAASQVSGEDYLSSGYFFVVNSLSGLSVIVCFSFRCIGGH